MPYKNADQQRMYQRTWVQERRRRLPDQRRLTIRRLKEESPCADCGLHWPYYVMQFDHVPERGEKLGSINYLLRTSALGVVMAEIVKCDLVCGNCHTIRGHRRRSDGPAGGALTPTKG